MQPGTNAFLASVLTFATAGSPSVAMLNPLLVDIASISVACSAEPGAGVEARDLCELIAARLRSRASVPVHVVDEQALPINRELMPSANHVWLKVRLLAGSGGADLDWGSAANIAGAGQSHGRAHVADPAGNADVLATAAVAATPFR